MRTLFTFAFTLVSISVCLAQIDLTAGNRKPKITGQRTLEVAEDGSITISMSDLEVKDRDDWLYPFGFTMKLYPGENYTLSDYTVTPSPNFFGDLFVQVTVNDGDDDSPPYDLKIKVRPVNDPPVITGQIPLMTGEATPIQIQFEYLQVTDSDNQYPQDFTMKLNAGSNYTVSGTTVTPDDEFYGILTVPVVVNDGKENSNVFSLQINVTAMDDRAILADIEESDLLYKIGAGPKVITETGKAFDPDNDSLLSAEIRFSPSHYQIAADELTFQNTAAIKGDFDIATGVLTLRGLAPLSEYTTIIRSVKYNFIPVVENKSVEKTLLIVLNDGNSNGPMVERRIRMIDLDIALDIPDAFTPNGDDANDTWKIKPLKQSEELTDAIVRVYTKSGKLVFEGKGFEREWDGRSNGELLPADTYYYTIDLNLKFVKPLRKGLITLLR